MSSLRRADPAALLVPRALLGRVPALDPARVVPLAAEDALAEPPVWLEGETSIRTGGVLFNPQWFGALYSRLRLADSAPVRYVPPDAPDPLDPALAERLYRAGVPIVTSLDVDRIVAARSAGWDLPRVVLARASRRALGSPRPRLVIVGEKDPRSSGYPFFASSGVWLFRALRRLGHDELSVYMTNACGKRSDEPNPDLAEIAVALAPLEPRWLALGKRAHLALKALGLQHATSMHPAAHRIFKHKEDVAGFARRLLEAGVARGPYSAGDGDEADVAMPVFEVDELPDLPELVAPPATTHAYQPQPRPATSRVHLRGAAVSSEKIDKARRAYVEGEAPTIKAAALLAEADPRRMGAIAVAQEWELERERYRAQVREAEYKRKAEAEAEARVQIRQRAALTSNLALKQVSDVLLEAEGAAKRVRDAADRGEAPSARDLKMADKRSSAKTALSLVRVLQAADEAPGAAVDPEKERRAKQSLGELFKEFGTVMQRNFGPIEDEAPVPPPKAEAARG